MNNKAFTLIELLVVISIIGVLSSIVFVSFSGSRDKARLAKAQNFDAQVSHALGAYAVGIWRFEEGSGTTAYDESGYGNDGTLHSGGSVCFNGTCPTWVDSEVYPGTSALKFDGADDYISCGSNSSLRLTDAMTVEAWVYLEQDKWCYWFHKGYHTPGAITLGYHESVNKWMLVYDTTLRYWGDQLLNQWVHIVVTYDKSLPSANWKTYQNGIPKETYNHSGGIMSSNHALNIGYSRYWNGKIDNVCIYNEALSSAQIQQHFVAGAPSHGIAVNQ